MQGLRNHLSDRFASPSPGMVKKRSCAGGSRGCDQSCSGSLCRERPSQRPHHGEERGCLPALRSVRRTLSDRSMADANLQSAIDACWGGAPGIDFESGKPMAKTSLAVVFSGSGGFGAMSAGELLLLGRRCRLLRPNEPAVRCQVRGGEAAALVQISTAPVSCQPDRFDLFVALDWEKVDQFAPEIPLDEGTIIIADPQSGPTPQCIVKSKARTVPFSMSNVNATPLERALQGKHTNVFAAGAVAACRPTGRCAAGGTCGRVGGEECRGDAYQCLGPQDGHRGRGCARSRFAAGTARAAPRWLLTGNQALAVGSLRGGVRFVGCYPITPATDLVEWLAPQLQKLDGRLVMAEDELASINMVLGASYGGVPAMTVTSGPGLSLMVESIGLGIAAEVPAVIIDVMRGGPSTGIPSKTEQSDINIAVYGGHGDGRAWCWRRPRCGTACSPANGLSTLLNPCRPPLSFCQINRWVRLTRSSTQSRSVLGRWHGGRNAGWALQAIRHRIRSRDRHATSRDTARSMGGRRPHA